VPEPTRTPSGQANRRTIGFSSPSLALPTILASVSDFDAKKSFCVIGAFVLVLTDMPKNTSNYPIPPRLLKTKQAAEYLAISPWKLRNLVQEGLLPFIEDGGVTSPWRFDVRDLDAYIERSRRLL
jgi:excisionase family DNA binding protein